MIRLDAFEIYGGKKLKGSVTISGSKNASLPCLFATLLTDEPCVIENIPDLQDIRIALALLRQLGKKVTLKNSTVYIKKGEKLNPEASYDLVRRMRASVVVMGPLLARLGKAHVSLPGGCSIGARPINFHIEAFKKLGAKIYIEEGYIRAQVDSLRGAKIRLPFPSVGATENVLMSAVLAKGKTLLSNAAREPEITDLAQLLISMGARISGAGTSRIFIEGVPSLQGARHRVIPDRIEAGTFLIGAAITKGNVTLQQVDVNHIRPLVDLLKRSGLSLQIKKNTIKGKWVRPLRALSVKTKVYPGFPTDIQAQWMALMTLLKGKSRVTEAIFENRFLHAHELTRMGAKIKIDGNTAFVEGVSSLSGCPLMVSDLRAGAALVLAGLAAHGKTRVQRVYHLDRGYDRMEKKLRKLGAKIKRIRL